MDGLFRFNRWCVRVTQFSIFHCQFISLTDRCKSENRNHAMDDNNIMDRLPFWDGHRERLRIRMETGGLEALRPHEVLELMLAMMVPRADMEEVCRGLIDRFGGVEEVLNAERRQLERCMGMTRKLAEWLMVIGDIINAYRDIDVKKNLRIRRFGDILGYIVPLWRYIPPPQTWVLFAERDGTLLGSFMLGDSLYIGAVEYAQEILENALMLRAKLVFMVGFFGIEPLELYDEEYVYLEELADLLSGIDVQLMDYVLVGEAGFVSLFMTGKLDHIRLSELEKRLRERYVSEEGEDEDDGYRTLHESDL